MTLVVIHLVFARCGPHEPGIGAKSRASPTVSGKVIRPPRDCSRASMKTCAGSRHSGCRVKPPGRHCNC
jgi:hypothetical protein